LAYHTLGKIEDLVAQERPQRHTVIAWNALSTWVCKLHDYACGIRQSCHYFKRWQNGEE